jgi:hypothetical protein
LSISLLRRGDYVRGGFCPGGFRPGGILSYTPFFHTPRKLDLLIINQLVTSSKIVHNLNINFSAIDDDKYLNKSISWLNTEYYCLYHMIFYCLCKYNATIILDSFHSTCCANIINLVCINEQTKNPINWPSISIIIIHFVPTCMWQRWPLILRYYGGWDNRYPITDMTLIGDALYYSTIGDMFYHHICFSTSQKHQVISSLQICLFGRIWLCIVIFPNQTIMLWLTSQFDAIYSCYLWYMT